MFFGIKKLPPPVLLEWQLDERNSMKKQRKNSTTKTRLQPDPPDTQTSLRLTRDECDFRGITELTKLKVAINYEFLREAALEGDKRAGAWLDKEYQGGNRKPFKDVPPHLIKQWVKRLKKQEIRATIEHLLPTLEDIQHITPEAYKGALESGQAYIPLPVCITPEQLSKVEGLTPEKYQEFIRKRGGVGEGLITIKRDFSIPTKTFLQQVRLLDKSLPLKPIKQEAGKSSTLAGLRIVGKALAVYRLLHRGGLSIDKAINWCEAEGIPAPYSQAHEQRWRDAQHLASSLLDALKKGKFEAVIRKFLASRQARKLFPKNN
jgi:hypothetical protein